MIEIVVARILFTDASTGITFKSQFAAQPALGAIKIHNHTPRHVKYHLGHRLLTGSTMP